MTEITKKQVQEYISENFDTFFVDALAKYVKEIMFEETDTEEDIEEYKGELKHLIWDAVSHGTKEYLEEFESDAIKIMATEFAKEFSHKKISIKFE